MPGRRPIAGAGAAARPAPGCPPPCVPARPSTACGATVDPGPDPAGGSACEAAIIGRFRSRSTAAHRHRGSPTVTIDLHRPPSVGASCCTEDWRAQARRLARAGAQARLGALLRRRGGRVPAEVRAARPGCRTPRGRDWDEPYRTTLRRVRRRPAARRSASVAAVREAVGRRRGLPAARRAPGSSGAQAARRDAAARRVRGGRRQPARRALRPRQRLAHDGAASARSTSCATRRSRCCSCTSSCAGTRSSTGRTSFFHIEQLGRDRRAPPRRRAAARGRPDRVRDRDQLRVRDRLHEPAVRRARRRSRTSVGDRMFEKMVGSIQSDEARHAQIGAPGAGDGRGARSRVRAAPASTSGSGGAGCCSRS